MYCSNCGKALRPQMDVCLQCGVRIKKNAKEKDSANIAVNLLSFCCIPILGIIMYFVWKDTRPNAAKSALFFGLISFALGIIVYGLFIFLGIFIEFMSM